MGLLTGTRTVWARVSFVECSADSKFVEVRVVNGHCSPSETEHRGLNKAVIGWIEKKNKKKTRYINIGVLVWQ